MMKNTALQQQIGVRSWPLLDISAGIPPKKRRLLLVPPPSPPRNEAQSSPTGKETGNGKKIDEAQSNPCKETENVKMIDGSCSDLKKEGSLSDLKIPEQSNPVCNSIPESVPTVKIIGEDGRSECLNPEGSGLDLKNKTVNDSEKRPMGNNPPDNTPDLSEVKHVDSLEIETKFWLTEEYAAPDVPLNTVDFPLAGQEGKIPYKQDVLVQNNEGSSPGHGKSDASQLSLSLSKGTSSMEKKATDVIMGKVTGKGKDDLSPIRMNWDLNTPMDSWDGSDVDASKKGSCTTTYPNSILQFLNSTDSGSIFINKGKQLIGTEEHASKHSDRPIASIHGNHELEDSLRLTLGMASGEMKKNEGLSVEVASISPASAGSVGCEKVKPEPSGDNSKKTRVFVDSCSVQKESAEKLSGQTSVKSEPVMEDTRGLHRLDDVALQHGLLKSDRFFHRGGSSSGLSPVSSLATSSAHSASVGKSNQSEFTFQTSYTQASNCSTDCTVQVSAEVHEHAQKLLETEASGHEMVTVKADAKFSNNSEISQLKISKNRNNSMRVNGDGSVSDEEKLNISVETREYECYGSECESDGNHGLAIRFKTQDIHPRDEDDFEDGEVREAQAHLHTANANMDTPETEYVKLVNSDANSTVCIDGGIRNNSNDNSTENPCDRTVDNINDECLTDQDPTLTTNDKLLADTSQIKALLDQKGCIPDCTEAGIVYDEPSRTFNRTTETMGETTDDNVHSDEMGNKLDSSPSKVDVTLKRDGTCTESTNGSNKSRIITLPRTPMASPFETKFFRSGREREDVGSDGRHGFVRERFQEPYFRNPRNNYTRGRGGGRFGGGRMGKPWVDWDSEHRFNQSKFSAYNDNEMEPSNYPIAPNDVDTSRGRKPIKDLPSFYRPFTRRQSLSGRDDHPPTRDMRRNNDTHGADFVGLRNEKFSRPNNSSYNRSNSGYEDGDDGQFVPGRGGTRNFSTGLHRFFPKVRSKSPIGSRNHSPGGGAWSPPRRRSPDRFKLLPKVVQRRPGSLYGASDTMSFPEDIVARRRASPSYVSRTTNLDSGTEHGHPRPCRRSPSDRVFNRSSGRHDVLMGGPQISRCADDNDFFGRSAGFREVNGEGSSSKFSERNHSFRPTYNTENEDRRFHVDNGPRSFRFRSDGGDNEYPEGRNMGGDNREFEGRIKNRHIAENPRRLNY